MDIFNSLFIKDKNEFLSEPDDGNIEYKWRLDLKNNQGIKRLNTQMLWRLNEGFEISGVYQAYYLLGVYDNGSLGSLSESDINETINIFKNVLKISNINVVFEHKVKINESFIYFAHITKETEEKIINEKNVIIIGDQQTGKTSLISNICYDINLRDHILKHMHEKIKGITTDIKKEIVGIRKLNNSDKIINYNDYTEWYDILTNSDYVINLYDVPVINIKNTITYLNSILANLIIIISNNKSSDNFTNEVKFYIDYCKFFNIDYYVFYKEDIYNYDKKLFTNIFSNLKKNNNNLIYSNSICGNSVFRVVDYYDIPDRGYIISGIQINNKFIINNSAYLLINNDYIKINIKSIHKKNNNFKSINKNESGCINFEIETTKKIKLSKNMSVVSDIIEKTNTINVNWCKKIKNGTYTCILYNGNIYNKNEIIVNDNIVTLTNPIIILDRNIIFDIDGCFYLCYIVT